MSPELVNRDARRAIKNTAFLVASLADITLESPEPVIHQDHAKFGVGDVDVVRGVDSYSRWSLQTAPLAALNSQIAIGFKVEDVNSLCRWIADDDLPAGVCRHSSRLTHEDSMRTQAIDRIRYRTCESAQRRP